jgi:hypothetical protein
MDTAPTGPADNGLGPSSPTMPDELARPLLSPGTATASGERMWTLHCRHSGSKGGLSPPLVHHAGSRQGTPCKRVQYLKPWV